MKFKTVRRTILRWLALLAGAVLGVDAAALLALFRGYRRYGHRLPEESALIRRTARKPLWVVNEIIHLKVQMRDAGCRKIAATFNRLNRRRDMTVSKSFVSETVRRQKYAILVARRHSKHRRPGATPLNRVWGVDLTGKRDGAGEVHVVLGVLEHGARAALVLQRLVHRSSLGVIAELLRAMRRYGRPWAIRTDNEAIFASRTFRFWLALLGIRHQRTDLHCPWQNGRVERLFGTLKSKLDRWAVASAGELDRAVRLFRLWYNHVRTHNHLDDRTPAEAWACRPACASNPRCFEGAAARCPRPRLSRANSSGVMDGFPAMERTGAGKTLVPRGHRSASCVEKPKNAERAETGNVDWTFGRDTCRKDTPRTFITQSIPYYGPDSVVALNSIGEMFTFLSIFSPVS